MKCDNCESTHPKTCIGRVPDIMTEGQAGDRIGACPRGGVAKAGAAAGGTLGAAKAACDYMAVS